jgi:hypothetical protein
MSLIYRLVKGSPLNWIEVDSNFRELENRILYNQIPDRTGNQGKFLSTDGNNLSWQTIGKILDFYTCEETDAKFNDINTSIDALKTEATGSKNVKLFTPEQRLLITNNQATLPVPAIGGMVWNRAELFSDATENIVMMEVTVRNDANTLYFYPEDNVNGYYCVVSYLVEDTSVVQA